MREGQIGKDQIQLLEIFVVCILVYNIGGKHKVNHNSERNQSNRRFKLIVFTYY